MIIAPFEPAAKASTLLQALPERRTTVGMARIDDPPPYVPAECCESRTPPRRPVPPVPRATSSTLTLRAKPSIPATNYLYIKTRQEPISGIFHIDPEVQTVALDKTGATAIDRREYNRVHRQRHRHHGRKKSKKLKDLPDPNAIFETRQGAIALDLSISAALHDATYLRTLVQAATKQGSVDINVHTIHARRRLNMEVTSRKGDICVLIPRSFSGYIQLYFRHGQPIFLPNLAASMKLVQRYEREAQVIVGDTINHLPARGSEWGGDTLHLAARQGDIFIGYVGEDQKPASEPGLWKKFTGLFHAAPSKT